MKFLISQSAFIFGEYIEASLTQPRVISLPSDAISDHISRTWKPLDKEAVAALTKLGVKDPKLAKPVAAAAVKDRADGKSMAELQGAVKHVAPRQVVDLPVSPVQVEGADAATATGDADVI